MPGLIPRAGGGPAFAGCGDCCLAVVVAPSPPGNSPPLGLGRHRSGNRFHATILPAMDPHPGCMGGHSGACHLPFWSSMTAGDCALVSACYARWVCGAVLGRFRALLSSLSLSLYLSLSLSRSLARSLPLSLSLSLSFSLSLSLSLSLLVRGAERSSSTPRARARPSGSWGLRCPPTGLPQEARLYRTCPLLALKGFSHDALGCSRNN